ncbi:MAG: aminotransferase class V-fold PLP-dependent enzyme, partial [Acidobacteriota bacterium]|nr:aminotransferase class V-fold PLP-dependent enzyme [Acidobacteriota bacterium]
MTLTEQRVYLDHNASCPLRPESRRAMLEVLEGDFGNPSSIHAEGRRARGALENARRRVAALVGCGDGELVFTSGGSESISAAVRGVCDRAPESMRRLVIPDTEHSAVLDAVGHARRRGFVVVTVPCDQ